MRQVRSTAHHSGAHCTEQELLPASTGCPFCGFPGERAVALQLQQAPAVELRRCPVCDGASASRMPSAERLDSYYAAYFTHDGEKVTFDLPPARFARHILGLMPRFAVMHARILDFGGGDGTLSAAAAALLLARGAESVHIDVVDYQAPSPSPGEGITISHARSTTELPEADYDLVLASSIVEHLPEPRPELQRLFSAIAPGGFFYARTPWIVPVFRLLGKAGIRGDFTYPAHLHDLGREFWERIVGCLPLEAEAYRQRHSAPSIVETGFARAPVRTLAAHLLKAPARVFPSWPFVGGWEVVFERSERAMASTRRGRSRSIPRRAAIADPTPALAQQTSRRSRTSLPSPAGTRSALP